MKLGMFIPEFPTQTHVFFWREICALRAAGLEVSILSTRPPAERCPHAFAREAAAETHYVYPPDVAAVARLALSPAALAGAAGYVLSLRDGGRARLRAAALATCAADLAAHARRLGLEHLHVHSAADAAHVAALARRMGGPPYSLHFHGAPAVYGRDHASKARDAKFVAAAAAPVARDVAAALGLAPDRVRTLTMGVDTERFSPAAPPAAVAAGGPLRLITVARLAAGKGHGHALAAIRAAVDRGSDLAYTIVGSGPDRAAIEADVAARGLGDRVRLLGSLGEEDVLAVLRSSDVFLLPSVGVFEASPVAVMEAMACGVPAIASRIGGTAEMIEDGADGLLVEQRDVAGLAAAIERLARDAALRRRMSAAARARAVEAFDSRACARALLDAIRGSGAGAPRGRGSRISNVA